MDKKTKNRKIALYTSIEVLLVFILTLLGSMWDWTHLTFSLAQIKTIDFWSETFIKSAQYSIALIGGIIYSIARLEVSSKDYFDELDVYRQWLKFKMDSFSKYINRFLNPSIKKEKIKQSIDKKLYRLDKHSKDYCKLNFQDAIDSGQMDNYPFKDEKARKYYIRRCELERLKSDDYIDKNIDSINQAYPAVNEHVFTPYLNVGASEDEKWKVENQTARDVSIKGSTKFVLVTMITVLMGLFLIQPSTNELLEQANGWIVVMIKYIIRIGMIVGNLVYGLWTGKKIFENNYIMVLQNRTRILKDYVNWTHDHNEKSYGDLILEAYRKNLEIEKQTREDLEKEYKEKYDKKLEEKKNEMLTLVKNKGL